MNLVHVNGQYFISNVKDRIPIKIGDKVVIVSKLSMQKWIQLAVVTDLYSNDHTGRPDAMLLDGCLVCPVASANCISIL